MTLRADIATDLAASLFDPDGLAREVTYTPRGAEAGVEAGAAILALVVEDGEQERGAGRYLPRELTVTVKVADVAAPGNGDRVDVDGQSWTVRKITAGNGFIWILTCTRGERAKLER